MPVTIIKKSSTSGHATSLAAHSSISNLQRLWTKQFAELLNVRGTTLFNGINSGRYPAPDGFDGKRPYWTVSTALKFLQGPTLKLAMASNDIAIHYRKAVKQLSAANEAGWATGVCPFHDDHHPSLSVNLKHGGYKCHACGASGRSVRSFVARLQAMRRNGKLANGIAE